jgi:hypothetical protein
MATGLATAALANKMLDHLRGGTAWAQPAGIYAKLHVGDPGPAGTANPSAVTTRVVDAFSSAASGTISQTGTAPAWTMTATETITYVSFWDASTAGNFLWSAKCVTPKPVVSGDVVTLTTNTLSLTPLAA